VKRIERIATEPTTALVVDQGRVSESHGAQCKNLSALGTQPRVATSQSENVNDLRGMVAFGLGGRSARERRQKARLRGHLGLRRLTAETAQESESSGRS
jgi:hypothetical protein